MHGLQSTRGRFGCANGDPPSTVLLLISQRPVSQPLLRHIRPGLRVRHRIQEPGPEGPVPVTRIYGGFREVGTGPGKYDKIRGTVHDAARTPVFSEIDRRQELYPGEDLPNQGKYEIVLGMFLFICCFFSLIGV